MRILFSLRGSSRNLETDGVEQRRQIIRHKLVQAVEFATFFVWEATIPADWRQQTGGERCVNLLEQLEKGHTDRAPFAYQSIPAGMRDFLDQALGPQLVKIVAERSQ